MLLHFHLVCRDIATKLQPLLLDWLTPSASDASPPWRQALRDLMVEQDHTVQSVSSLLSNFVRQGQCTISGNK